MPLANGRPYLAIPGPSVDGAAPAGASSSAGPLSPPSRPQSMDSGLRLLHYAAPVLYHLGTRQNSEAYFRRVRTNTKSLFEAWIGIVAVENGKDIPGPDAMKPFMQDAAALVTSLHFGDGRLHSVKDWLGHWFEQREAGADPITAPGSETANACTAFAARFALNDMRARTVVSARESSVHP